jgi:putative membrane protein insertion efficiency factor
MNRLLELVIDLPRQALLGLVRAYRLLLKPSLGNACRFEPTCSQYALDALQRHGAIAGAALSAGRLLRCHPWCAGGCDPVPEQAPGLFTRLGLGAPVPPTSIDGMPAARPDSREPAP